MTETSKKAALRLRFMIVEAPTIAEICQSMTRGDEYHRRSVTYQLVLMEDGDTSNSIPIEVKVIVDTLTRVHEGVDENITVNFWQVGGRIVGDNLWGFPDCSCVQYMEDGTGEFHAFDSYRLQFGHQGSEDILKELSPGLDELDPDDDADDL